MEPLIKYTNDYSYWPKYFQQEMDWFYFDNMTHIHARELSFDNKFPVMMSVIKSFYFYNLKYL